MDQEVAVKVTNLSKTFVLPHKKVNSLKQLFIHEKGFVKKEKVKVLDDISLEVSKGEFMGIVGRNGSGKSTLLKIIAGVYYPSQGELIVNGILTPFIELGVGFNPELSGRENVFLNGALLGFNRHEIQKMYDSIVDFAELQGHMDQKLKNYSSGMQVRLAFSIAIRSKSDILLIDEVLAVGDARFQKKCFDIFDELKASGRTVIFVTHSMEQVKRFCDRVAVIDKGKLVYLGHPGEATKVYDKLNSENYKKADLSIINTDMSYRIGSGAVKFDEVNLDQKTYKMGGKLRLTAHYTNHKKVKTIYYGISIYSKSRAQSVYAISGKIDPSLNLLSVTIGKLTLNPGQYQISVGLTDNPDSWSEPYDLMEKKLNFTIEKSEATLLNTEMLGPVYMETEVTNAS